MFRVAFWLSVCLAVPCTADATQFYNLGAIRIQELAVSGDGGTVAGAFQPLEAFRWTPQGGFESLGFLPGGFDNSRATDLSSDGSIVVGGEGTTTSASGQEAFIWTPGSGMVGLGPGTSASAWGVSGDGQVVVAEGPANGSSVIWTESTGVLTLGIGFKVEGLSRDTTIVPGSQGLAEVVGAAVGTLNTSQVQGPARWTPDDGIVHLGFAGSGLAINADGTVVVGWSALGGSAFRWTESGGREDLPTLGGTTGLAYSVSADGETVVGTSRRADSSQAAFIWDPIHGTRDLEQVLLQQGVDLGGLSLTSALDISDDGRTIAGFAKQGLTNVGWVAMLPEPGPAVLFLFGAAGLVLRRRSSPRLARGVTEYHPPS